MCFPDGTANAHHTLTFSHLLLHFPFPLSSQQEKLLNRIFCSNTMTVTGNKYLFIK